MWSLSELERSQRAEARKPKVAAAEKFWAEAARKREWDRVRLPMDCFPFERDGAAARAGRETPEYIKAVISEVGLEKGRESPGYRHLSDDGLAALLDLLRRKAAAFWAKGSPRTVMRGFRHDVVTTGLPVRGRPIRLKGPEAEFVREEVEAGVGARTVGGAP